MDDCYFKVHTSGGVVEAGGSSALVKEGSVGGEEKEPWRCSHLAGALGDLLWSSRVCSGVMFPSAYLVQRANCTSPLSIREKPGFQGPRGFP